MLIYHITTGYEVERARQTGKYITSSLVSEGFIHASTDGQVIGTANLLFRGRTGLVLLVIDTEKLTSELRFDPGGSHGEIQKFPHIYGPIDMKCVVDVVDFPPEEDGTFVFPAGDS